MLCSWKLPELPLRNWGMLQPHGAHADSWSPQLDPLPVLQAPSGPLGTWRHGV